MKGRNNKVFSNIDLGPKDTPNLAEIESLLWVEAHASLTQRITNLGRWKGQVYLQLWIVDVLQMDHRKVKIISRDMANILHYKALMD